jgi:excisionase family DNA binding protein
VFLEKHWSISEGRFPASGAETLPIAAGLEEARRPVAQPHHRRRVAASRRPRRRSVGSDVDLEELRISRAAVVTVAQAAAVFGVDVRTVARAIENGELPALRLGRRVLIPRLPLLAALGVVVDDGLTGVHNADSGDR